MPRAKVGKRYIIVKDFRKFPKNDYTENFLKYKDSKGRECALSAPSGEIISLSLRGTLPRLIDQLPKAIKRGNDLMFPIPEDSQVIKLTSEVILGIFVYRRKIYTISFPVYKDEEE